MGWTFINGLLAFAITMIVLSTIMAAIVEFLFELRRKRKYYMRAYLLNFFDTQILPDFHREIVEVVDSQGSQTSSTEANQIVANVGGGWKGKINKLVMEGNRWTMEVTSESSKGGRRSKFWTVVIFLLIIGAMIVLAALLKNLLIPSFLLIVIWYFADRWAIEIALDSGIDAPTSHALKIEASDVEKLNRFRQKFVNDIAKLGKDDSNRKDYATRLSATEFAAALGRSDLAHILVDAGRDKLDLLITDVLRRFDHTGVQSREEFKRQATKLSVIAAFVTAFALNINAVSLLDTYFSDDELSDRIIALYSEEELADLAVVGEVNFEDRLQDLSKIEEKIARAETDTQTPDEALNSLKEQAADLRDEINQIVAGLTDAGIPIGWRHYPFCMKDSIGGQFEVVPGCEGLKQYSEHFCAALSVQSPANEQTTSSQIEDVPECHGDGVVKDLPFMKSIEAHFIAAYGWATERQKGSLFWVVGVLLAGVLIGLGGPFWFDFYRRLAVLSQASRNIGFSSQPRTTTASVVVSSSGVEEAETQHAPPSAPTAFKDAVEARNITRGNPTSSRLPTETNS